MENLENADRIQQNNVNFEMSILSSIIFNPQSLDDISEQLKPHHLYSLSHQKIYEAILNLKNNDKPIDESFIDNELKGGYRAEMMSILTANPISNAIPYIVSVVEFYNKREVRKMLLQALGAIDGGDASADDVVTDLFDVYERIDKPEQTRAKSFDQIKDHVLSLPPEPVYPTGISFLDEALKDDDSHKDENGKHISGGFETGQLVLISGDPEAGKAQPLDARIYTPDGFKLMGNINIGDKVIGSNGQAIMVKGVYPQGSKEAYQVTFDDGSSVVCCDEHLWSVRTRKDRARKRDPRVITLREMMDDPNMIFNEGEYTRCKYSIDVVDPVDFSAKEQPLDPYLIGYLIGNGNIGHYVGFSTMDQEVVEELSDLLPDGYRVRYVSNYDYTVVKVTKNSQQNVVWEILKEIGLAGKGSHDKFIPSEYLYGSIKQRTSLLQGLMDSDGYVTRNKAYYEYTTVSKRLADDFIELVRSFGSRARMVKKNTQWTHNGILLKSFAYRITFSFKNNTVVPVRLERKIANIKPREKVLYKFIRSIEYVGEKQMQCISVDAKDKLYVTDDFTLTHNTMLGMQALKNVTEKDKALLFAFEFTTKAMVKTQIKTEGKDYSNKNLMVIDEGYDIQDILKELRYWRKQGVRYVMIDSQMRIENAFTKGTTMEERESEKFSLLAKFAHRNDMIIILIIQTSKSDAAASVISPMGSKKGAHEASIILHIKRLKDDEANGKKEMRELIMSKNKQNGVHFKGEIAFNPYTLKFTRPYSSSNTVEYQGHKPKGNIPVEHKDVNGVKTGSSSMPRMDEMIDMGDEQSDLFEMPVL